MQRRAFTLVELLVSILVLLAIIAATARIFGATSKVAGLGEANADLQSLATAIERTIRRDVSRMSTQGFLVIQCVAVRNDTNQKIWSQPTAPLLDPTRPPTEFLRCDQLVFMAKGQEPTKNFEGSSGGNTTGYGYSVETYKGGNLVLNTEGGAWEQLVRLGHGLQFPQLVSNARVNPPQRPDADLFSYPSGQGPVVPWTWQPPGAPKMSIAFFDSDATPSPALAFGSQPEARRWTLSRQAVLLADDGGSATQDGPLYYRGSRFSGMPPNSAPGIAQKGTAIRADYNPIRNGEWLNETDIFPDRRLMTARVDVAATSFADFRQFLERQRDLDSSAGGLLPWNKGVDPNTANPAPNGSVRHRLSSSLFGGPLPVPAADLEGMWGWPRAERTAPSMDRSDIMTTAGTLAGNCSSFQVDWTWAEGVGRQLTLDGTPQLADALPDSTHSGRINDIPLPGVMLASWPGPVPGFPGRIDILSSVTPKMPWFGIPDTLLPPAQRSGATTLAGGLPTSQAAMLGAAKFPPGTGTLTHATAIQVLKSASAGTVEAGTAQQSDMAVVAVAGPPIDPVRIEGSSGLKQPFGAGVPVYVYRAVFGWNGDRPYTTVERKTVDPNIRKRQLNPDYTPWPTALRFTFTLHDPKLTMPSGRTYQFIVDLPQPVSP